jgi:tetratricopeptide (TPR) repeat protein
LSTCLPDVFYVSEEKRKMKRIFIGCCQKNAGKSVWRSFIVSLLFLPLLGCSAYLNTLYNGKNAFREAQILHSKKAKNFPDSLLVTAPAEATTKYERTIEKTIKVVEAFPKKKKWHDDALLLMGKAYYYKKDFQKAIRRFKELQTDFPASPFIPETYIYLGRCYIEDGSFDKAEEALQVVLTKYPQYDENQQVTMLLVEIAVRREGRSEAIILLEKAMRSAKSDQKRVELVLRISQLYIDMRQYQKALPLLQSVQRKKDYPEQSYRLDRAMLTCFIETGKLSDALLLVSNMASSRLYLVHYDEIMYEKGLILKTIEKYDDAIDVFKKICKDIDSSGVTKDTSTIKGKAFYQLGLIYQLKKGSYKKAVEYFTLASLSTDTSVNKRASKRVLAMKTLDSLRNYKESSSEKSLTKERRMIMIGELFKFDLEEPDSAYNEYLKLNNDTTVSKETAAKAISAAAIIARDNKKDSTKADSLFRLIIQRYPMSAYAQLAQKELRIPITIMTRQDSASAAYKTAEELFYQSNDVKGAIRSFYDVYKNYSELDIAPKGLYAAAWYSDNVLQKKSTAKSLYEKICEKYQKSIYCSSSAQSRIKTVNDTLAALNEVRKKLELQQNRKNQSSSTSGQKVKESTAVSDSVENSTRAPTDAELFSKEELDDKSMTGSQQDSSLKDKSPVAQPVVEPGKK